MLTDTNPNNQLGWTATGRWLMAITDHQLRAYDTRTGRMETIDVDGGPILHLTTVGARGV